MPRSRSVLFIRLTCLSLVLALFLSGLPFWFPKTVAAAFFTPQSPPPDDNLPDLDAQQMISPPAPQAPNPIPSTATPWSPYDTNPYLPGNYSWLIFNSSTGVGASQTWGVSGDKPVPADYDGDGKADIAIWRPSSGSWQIIQSSNGAVFTQSWGVNGDIPVPADYDGDGKADLAVWRPSSGTWYIIKSSNGSILATGWGVNGDIPVPAKYDADSKADLAIWRPSTGIWWIINSSDGSTTTVGWGTAGDKVVPADYDGDGKTDVAIWRPSSGTWYIIKSSNGSILTTGWGIGSDKPVPADYDGDGKTDVAIWRPSEGIWQIIQSSNGAVRTQSWGINGDALVPAKFDPDSKADLAICRASLPADNFANARLDTANRTGQPGEDLFSGNFNWSLPLVGLAGRSGLDLGLSLTYNSLVWTRDDGAIKFNADNGYPSPGFRLGLPQIQGSFTSAQTGMPAYLMIMPSGYRVELRKVGSTNLYESADSSYMQFDAASLLARMSDGTQLSFALYNQEYRCTQIKDCNGNLITASYETVSGRLLTITDTLGRILTFIYDGFGNLQKITQPWNGVTHNWATFGYANQTLQTSFSGLTAVGPNNGSAQPVLTQVGLADGSRYVFSYNSYLQVNLITHKAPDDHELSHISYDLPPAGVSQVADCPRFTKRADQVERWNGGSEVETTFSLYSPSQNYGLVNLPDGTKYKETFGSFDYQKGLTLQTDTLLGAVSKKTTVTTWTQDDTTLSYILNPRPTRTDISDDQGNSRHSAISYLIFALPSGVSCALPSDINEYAVDGTTVLRQTHTTYITGSPYITSSRRIIGLPDTKTLYEGSGVTLLSKVDYQYDLADDATTSYLVATSSVPVNHDAAYNDTNFRQGRGNLCLMRRYDVSTMATANNPALAAKFSTGYDTAGNIMFSRDPADHKTTLSYADMFVQTGTPSTVAYVTKITDPDGNFSMIQYDYDLGMAHETTDPKLAKRRTTYDAAGRVARNEINNGPSDSYTGGAYTRYVYDNTLTRVNRFNLVQTGLAEHFTFQQLDGIGRVTATASTFPNSTGGYRGQAMFYDTMGRVTSQSNPTEITKLWEAIGDDASWIYTLQSYDWKGRPLITTNPGSPQTTRQFSYVGCGCAGGEQVTYIDESSRKQRTTYDVLGRVAKTEVFNSNGSTVYATTGYSYNGRDQVMLMRQYQGPEGSTTFQDTVMTYDGHGRLQTRKLPIESSACQYEYYDDDLLKKRTDPRQAKTTYTYNGRHLVTNKSYFKPGQTPPGSQPETVPEVDPVNFDYDEAGNRKSMENVGHDHGQGRTDYAYDTFSRLKTETRKFNDVLDGSGNPANWVLTYDYNLAGQLKSMTDAFGQQTVYDYNQAGELTTATVDGVNFLSAIRYRAWGGLKQMDTGNQLRETLSYNSRLQVTQHQVLKPSDSTLRLGYEYRYDFDGQASAINDGRLRYARDLTMSSSTMDRSYSYDHVGRLISGFSGNEARGETNNPSGPYNHTYGYDAFDNMTARRGRNGYAGPGSVGIFYDAVYVNDRKVGPVVPPSHAWTYNEAGNLTDADEQHFVWNAAGQNSQVQTQTGSTTTMIQYLGYDGDDQQVLRTVDDQTGNPATSYSVRSSLLGGQAVNEIGASGASKQRYLYANGQKVGRQKNGNQFWVNEDVATLTYVETDSTGAISTRVQMDPLGVVTGTGPSGSPPPGGTVNPSGYYGNPASFGDGCRLDGAPFPCDWLTRLISSGSVTRCPDGSCQRSSLTYVNGAPIAGVLEWFHATANGREGWVPVNAVFYASGNAWHYPGSDAGGKLGYASEVGFRLEGIDDSKSDCAKFVDTIGNYTNPYFSQTYNGYEMGAWAQYGLTDNPGREVSGFQEKYVAGGQNGWAMVHIAAFAALTLIGENPWRPFASETGYDVAARQFQDDTNELNKGLDAQRKGFKTTGDAGIQGYNSEHPIQRYIDEKHAERWDDGAGILVGRTLEKVRQKRLSLDEARKQIFNLLCDR